MGDCIPHDISTCVYSLKQKESEKELDFQWETGRLKILQESWSSIWALVELS